MPNDVNLINKSNTKKPIINRVLNSLDVTVLILPLVPLIKKKSRYRSYIKMKDNKKVP